MPERSAWTAMIFAGVAVVVAGGFLANHVEARHRLYDRVQALPGGDPGAGRTALAHRPCGGCHEIPGVTGARGRVGPPLTGFASRAYIAGRLDNTPANLTAWIVNPHAT